MWSRRFQVTLLKLLLDHKFDNLREVFHKLHPSETTESDYLVLPVTVMNQRPMIDWDSVTSVLFSSGEFCSDHIRCDLRRRIHTKNGPVCSCMLQNSLVYTPHNGHVYCITGILNNLNGNSLLNLRDGRITTYKKYFVEKYVLL